MKEAAFSGTVAWLGATSSAAGSLRSLGTETLALGFHGLSGARHEGENRPSCSRMTILYPKGTETRNVRQLSILVAEDIGDIAETLGRKPINGKTIQDVKLGRFHVFEFLAHGRSIQ